MPNYVYIIIGFSIIFLATSIGASFVFFFKKKEISKRLNQIFLGFSAGIMISASFFSLLKPALEFESNNLPTWFIVGLSTILGALFLWGIDKLVPHFHTADNKEEGIQTKSLSKNAKMFLAVTIHNVPEGLSVGIAFGVAMVQTTHDIKAALLSALMLAVGIGIQNIPEGAVVSLPFKSETGSSSKAFWFGTLSGIVEPIAAIFGFFLAMQISSIMPYALAFAAGCMLYVVAEEMIPEMKGESDDHYGVWFFIIGFVIMMVLDVVFG